MIPSLQNAGVEVANSTVGSALICFPMATIEDVLNVRDEQTSANL
jgi:hypothetical protein